MAHENHEKAIRQVYIGLAILAVITLIEVGVSLFGKGHILEGMGDIKWVVYICALLIIVLSLYKAKFIIYEFMHMRYEVPGLVRSVLLPVLLLVWGIIAFFYEGNYWKVKRTKIQDRNELKSDYLETKKEMGTLNYDWKNEDLY
jgi:cytochrome c oxidase subunit IV